MQGSLIFQDLEDNQIFRFDDSVISNYCDTCEYEEAIYIKSPFYLSIYLCKCYYCGREYTTASDICVQIVRTINV
jgi:hypothetical protein